METNVITHAQALIRCPSVTPEEGGALDYLSRVLSEAGFTCWRLPFSAPGTAAVDNLYARIGDRHPHICFAGHTDVVPPGDADAWKYPPFGGEIHDGVLYGRGATDMKGGVAASLEAVLAYLSQNHLPNGSLSFLITGDEEGPAVNGTAKVVEWLRERGERIDFCVLSECTAEDTVADTIKIGRRGSLSAKLTLRGTQGHVAYPQKSNNPLPRLIEVLTLLKSKPLDNGSEHFQRSHLEITSIDTGNPTANLIPATTVARFNVRFNDTYTGETLKAWVETQVATALLQTGIAHRLDYEPVAESFMTAQGGFVDGLSSAVYAETGLAPGFSTSGGTSDARFIKDLCPVVEVGLRNAMAHKVDECVPVVELETLTRIFLRFIKETMTGSAPRD